MDDLAPVQPPRSKWEVAEADEDETSDVKARRRDRRAKKAAKKSSEPNAATQPPPQPHAPVKYVPAQPSPGPPIGPCLNVNDRYEKLNRIDEGTYGIVYRARDRQSGEIVALKRLKLDEKQRQAEGFPVTSLREITTLLRARHPNIVNVREIVTADEASHVFMVMEFVERDVKALMEIMREKKERFLQDQVRTMMHQLLSAVEHMHSRWLLHRDLKSSNLLMTSDGQLKLADFGLARQFSSPPAGNMTQIVVTLWYRAPELLLGATTYDSAVDMWSVGCLFAELVRMEPLFPGTSELDQINKIFALLSTPTDDTWPGFSQLPHCKRFRFASYPRPKLREAMVQDGVRLVTEAAMDLMERLLTFDPAKRISAADALRHAYFAGMSEAV